MSILESLPTSAACPPGAVPWPGQAREPGGRMERLVLLGEEGDRLLAWLGQEPVVSGRPVDRVPGLLRPGLG